MLPFIWYRPIAAADPPLARLISVSCPLACWLSLCCNCRVQSPLLRSVNLALLLGQERLLFVGHVWEQFIVADLLARLDTTVVGADDGIGIIDSNRTDVGQGLDLGGTVLVLLIRHLNVQLVSTRLDSVPSGKSRGEVHISRHAEIGGVDDLVGGWVVKNGLGVDTSLVGEGAESGAVNISVLLFSCLEWTYM